MISLAEKRASIEAEKKVVGPLKYKWNKIKAKKPVCPYIRRYLSTTRKCSHKPRCHYFVLFMMIHQQAPVQSANLEQGRNGVRSKILWGYIVLLKMLP